MPLHCVTKSGIDVQHVVSLFGQQVASTSAVVCLLRTVIVAAGVAKID